MPVFVDEILDDGLEGVREIQHIELDAKLVRHRARVGRVLGRAAPARVTVRVAGHAQAHEHARDLKPRVAQQPRRHRRIDPAAHGNQHAPLAIDHLAHHLASFLTTESTEDTESDRKEQGVGLPGPTPFFSSGLCVLCALCGEIAG
jgi:hypothetical protein